MKHTVMYVLYHQILEGPPTPGRGMDNKGGEFDMSPTQLNFSSSSEMLKIITFLLVF